MIAIQTEWIEVAVADGSRMKAFVARPEAPSAPVLLVFQEIFGVNDHIQELCRGFAAEGFIAVAPDLFHRTAPGFTHGYDDYKPGRDHAMKMTLEGIQGDVDALDAWFVDDAQSAGRKMGAVGYCMGGRISFLANTMLPLACAVSYYGGGIPNHLDRIATLKGPHLFFWGDLDTPITPEQRPKVIEALIQAKKCYMEVTFTGAGHGFNCNQRDSFSPAASMMARDLTLEFLRKYLDMVLDD